MVSWLVQFLFNSREEFFTTREQKPYPLTNHKVIYMYIYSIPNLAPMALETTNGISFESEARPLSATFQASCK